MSTPSNNTNSANQQGDQNSAPINGTRNDQAAANTSTRNPQPNPTDINDVMRDATAEEKRRLGLDTFNSR
jgi:hypothetical protein